METIRSSREIEKVFRSGRRASAKLLTAIVCESDKTRGPMGRVAFIAGKRLGSAVGRSRAKRVLREACRRAGGPWAGYDVVLLATASTGTALPSDLDRDLAGVLRSTGVLS